MHIACLVPVYTSSMQADIQQLNVSAGQKYYGTPEWIFSNRYAGSGNYDDGNDTAVSTGILAWREIHEFNYAKYEEYAHIYNGSDNGQLRSRGTELDAPYVTRFPINSLVQYAEVDGQSKVPCPQLPLGIRMTLENS